MPSFPSQACPVCRENTYQPFFELNNVPVQDGVLWNSQEAAFRAPTGDIRLAHCRSCGYIGNLLFEPERIRYDREYSFSLHFSPTYQAFINNLARRLIEQHQLENKTVLEIGCGQGDFLRELCYLGHNHGIGVDPTVVTREEPVGQTNIKFIQDLYTEEYADLKADFICCRQVLDQVARPKSFVDAVRRNLDRQPDTVVYFEVPNAANIFEELLIRNIIYEKSSWFTVDSLTCLFELSGFKVQSCEPCFEAGQYIGIEAQADTDDCTRKRTKRSAGGNFNQAIAAFRENYEHKVQSWTEQLGQIQLSGRRAIAWGAGSGAINLFNLLNLKEEIPYVIDINPKRQGKFLPITGQKVVPPDFLHEYQADLVVITNSTYEKEIKQQVVGMGIDCGFWVI